MLVSFCTNDCWLTIITQISDVSVVNSEVFHPALHISGTCADISLHMTKLTANVYSQTVLLSVKFNNSMLIKQNVIDR
jgi:hypothetical protein